MCIQPPKDGAKIEYSRSERKAGKMGIDIRIAVLWVCEGSPPSPNYAVEGEMIPGEEEGAPGSTHGLHSMTRYYSSSYERGPWPHIAAYLLELMSCPECKRVWYGGDHYDELEPVTIQWLTEMNVHYIANGERPYRQKAKAAHHDVLVATRLKPEGEWVSSSDGEWQQILNINVSTD